MGFLPWTLAPLRGPLGLSGALQICLGLLTVGLAALTAHVGVIAVWLGLGAAPRHPDRPAWPAKLTVGLVSYAVVWMAVAPAVGRASGRIALPCGGGPLQPQSVVYCLAHRNYVQAPLAHKALRIAERVASQHPGTITRYLDGGFPAGLGLPLLPHVSHGDGRRLDLALMWERADGQPADDGGSPLGYFGYVQPPEGGAACAPSWTDLRWDLDALQPLLVRHRLDEDRTRALVRAVLAEPGIGKVLIEPHLRRRLRLSDDRLRFQGCGAARHDDHIHIQL